jgi:hypothetical protein
MNNARILPGGMDRQEAIQILDEIANAATRCATLLRQAGRQEMLDAGLSLLEQSVVRLKRMRAPGRVLPEESGRLRAVRDDDCPRCRSTRSDPCGRGGRRCVDCGCTYGAD